MQKKKKKGRRNSDQECDCSSAQSVLSMLYQLLSSLVGLKTKVNQNILWRGNAMNETKNELLKFGENKLSSILNSSNYHSLLKHTAFPDN